jgi:ABC-type nitrate/sulfonate/bicarbonate transport system substrate-binding protein
MDNRVKLTLGKVAASCGLKRLSPSNPSNSFTFFKLPIALLVAAPALALLTSCNSKSGPVAETNKVRVGYIGLTCEAPIFTAVEKGFFKEEGLEVSLVKCEWSNYKDVLALGGDE